MKPDDDSMIAEKHFQRVNSRPLTAVVSKGTGRTVGRSVSCERTSHGRLFSAETRTRKVISRMKGKKVYRSTEARSPVCAKSAKLTSKEYTKAKRGL